MILKSRKFRLVLLILFFTSQANIGVASGAFLDYQFATTGFDDGFVYVDTTGHYLSGSYLHNFRDDFFLDASAQYIANTIEAESAFIDDTPVETIKSSSQFFGIGGGYMKAPVLIGAQLRRGRSKFSLYTSDTAGKQDSVDLKMKNYVFDLGLFSKTGQLGARFNRIGSGGDWANFRNFYASFYHNEFMSVQIELARGLGENSFAAGIQVYNPDFPVKMFAALTFAEYTAGISLGMTFSFDYFNSIYEWDKNRVRPDLFLTTN